MRRLAPLLLLTAALCASAETRVSGYLKSFAVTTSEVSQSQNSVRLMAERFGERSVWQVHYELSPVLTSREFAAANPTLATGRAWRLTDVERRLDNSARHDVFQNLDRFNVQFNLEAGDLTLGRQPVAFGMARVINPTDVFLPFDVRTFNTEYRIGVDAIRFQRPFGQLGEMDFGVIAGDDLRAATSAAFFQLRTNVDGHDIQLAAIRFAEHDLVGAGVQTALGDFGFWLEAAQVSGEADYARLSTGLDYAFSEDVYGLVEYHFNGAGSSKPGDYPMQAGTTPYRQGGVFLFGEHYLIGSVNVQLSPLWSLGTQALINLSDRSAFGSAGLTFNARQNLYVDLGLYAFGGGNNTEYGSNPETLYASLRYYF